MSEQSTDGIARTWDHEDCPRDDCDGELEQQDQYNVMCLSCERVWTHVNNTTKHYLQTQDFETVAEKPIVATDRGRMKSDITKIREGYAEEREDLAMDWSEYVCYLLEVDKRDVNHDELIHLSAVLACGVNSETEQ